MSSDFARLGVETQAAYEIISPLAVLVLRCMDNQTNRPPARPQRPPA